VKVNGSDLNFVGTSNSTNCFRAFLSYCIDKYSAKLDSTSFLRGIFKLSPNHPDFSLAAVKWKKVRNYNNFYYHDYQGTLEKIKIIKKVARDLNINVELKFNP